MQPTPSGAASPSAQRDSACEERWPVRPPLPLHRPLGAFRRNRGWLCRRRVRIATLLGAGVAAAFLTLATPGRSAEAQDEESRLRQALRNATLQLRSAESDHAAAQATQTALQDEKKALTERFEQLRKDVVAERAKSDRALAELKARVAAQEAEIGQLKTAEQKWQGSANDAAARATATETERAKLAAQVVDLERQVGELRTRNLELFRTGREILKRYENFSLGEALAAREPFVGQTRTRLENLVQGYDDNLAANRAK